MSASRGVAERAFETTLIFAAAIWLLRWSVSEVQPLLPFIVFAAVAYGFLQLRRH